MTEKQKFPSFQLVVDVLIRRVDRSNKKLTETNTGKYQLLGSFVYHYNDDLLNFEVFQKVVDASFCELSSSDLAIPNVLSLPQPPFLPRALKSPSQVLSGLLSDLAKAANSRHDAYLVFSPTMNFPALQGDQAPPGQSFSAISIQPTVFQMAFYVENKLTGTCSAGEACPDFQEILKAVVKVNGRSYSGRGFRVNGKFYFFDVLNGVLFQLPYQESEGTITHVDCLGSSLQLSNIQSSSQSDWLVFESDKIALSVNLKLRSATSSRLFTASFTTSSETRSGFLLFDSTHCDLLFPGDLPSSSDGTVYSSLDQLMGNVFQGKFVQVGARGRMNRSC